MRNPVRSEADAFHIVVAIVAVLVVAVALGALVDPAVGVALLVAGVAGALVWELRTKDPERRQPLREAHAYGRFNQPEGSRRVLVVANRTLASDALRAEILQRAQAGDAVHIVAPVLCSRAHSFPANIDRVLAHPRELLENAVAALVATAPDVARN